MGIDFNKLKKHKKYNEKFGSQASQKNINIQNKGVLNNNNTQRTLLATANRTDNATIKQQIQARYEANMQQVTNKKSVFNDIKNVASNLGLGVKKAGESSLSYMESMSNNSSNYKTYNKFNAKLNKEKEQLENLRNGKTIEGANITQTTLPGLNDFKQQTQKQTEVNPISLKAKENSQLESPINEYLNKKITADEEKIQRNIENSSNPVSKKIAELVPSIGQSVTGMAVSTINPGLGLAFWQTSAGGDYIRDAKARGMNDEDALKYGTIMGSMESATEWVGAELTKGVGKAIAKGDTIKGLKALGLDIGENFFEESIMEPLQETVATMTGGKKTADWSNMMKRMLQSGIDGALTSIIMGGASAGVGKATKLIGKMQEGETISQEEIADTLKEINKQEEIDIEKVLVNSFGFGAQDLYKNTTVQEQIDNKLNNIAGNMSQYEAGKLIDKSNLSEEQKASLKRVAEKHNMTTEEVQNLINNPPQEKMQQTSQNQATELANNEVLNNKQQITQEQNKMAENGNMGQIEQNNKNQVKIDSENFAKQVDNYISGNMKSSDFINVGKTSQVLQNIGLPNNNIILKQSKLKAIMQENNNPNSKLHGLSANTVKRIPEALANPLNVLQSSTNKNSVVVITDLADKMERPIIASIEMDYKGQIGNIDFLSNRLTSAYGKNNYDRFMQTEIAKGNLLYDIDEGIIKELPTSTRLQSSEGLNSSVDTVDKVSTSNNIIPQNAKNMQVQNENLANNQETLYNGVESEVDGNEIRRERMGESMQSNGILEKEESQYSEKGFRKLEQRAKSSTTQPTTEQQKLTESLNSKKEFRFFNGTENDIPAFASQTEPGVIYVNKNTIDNYKKQAQIMHHEILESEIAHNKEIRDISAKAIRAIVEDSNFEEQIDKFYSSEDDSIERTTENKYAIAKDILCDIYAERLTNDGLNYENILDLDSNIIIGDTLNEIENVLENSNKSSFFMKENQTRMPEQVLLPGAKRNKSLNPTQIANLTLQDANTTPELKSKEYAKGNKQSSFVSNIITDSKFLNEDLRQEMAKEDNIKYYRGITNKETLEKAYQSLNENGANATFEWFNKQDGNSTAEDVAKGWILLKQYQDTGDYKSAVEVAKKMRNMGTTAGQTVQAYNILSRLTPEGMFYYAQSELSEAYNKMAEGKSKKWLDENKNDFDLTPEETQFIIDKMESIQGVEDERTKKIALAEIQKLITDKIPAKASQSLKAWMRISMLFNPKTQVRNVAGNAVILPVNMASDFIASRIDKAISKKTGVRTTGNTNLKNYAKGFGKGLYESYDDFRRGINTRNIEGNRFEVSEGKNFKDKGIGKALNRVDNMLSFMLDAGDRGFYEATFTNSINNQLVLNNTTEVTKDMIDIATQEALQRTWQDNNAYTQTVLTIRNALNGKVGKSKGMGYGLGDILIPFAKTPANLTKAIVDYSPVGLTKTLALDARKLKNSLENGQYSPQLQHKFVQDLGKGMAGSLLYVLGYALANAGAITGETDEDKDVKNFMKNSLGISSYSIKIGDKTFAYDWAQPVATPFAIMTNFAKYNKENPDASVLDKAISSINIGTEQLLQQSFMESINTVLNGNGTTIENLSQAVLELPSRAIPTLSKQVADMVDSTQRTSFEYGKPIQSAVNSVVAKLPGASKSLPASIDTLGNEIQKYGGENNLWNVMFNPANMNKGKLSNAGAEIYKLYQQTGETTIFPITAPYYINNKGTKITMTSSKRTEYQRKTGQYTQKAVNELLSNNNYKDLSDDEKVELISEIVSDSNASAKYEVLGIESKQYEKQRKLIETISTDNYYDYKLNVMSKTNKKQIAENDDNAQLNDVEKMKIITDKRYSSKAKEAIYETYIKDAESKEYDELKEYYANNSALGAKNQRAYEIIDQYIDYKVNADNKIKELRANGTKKENESLTEVEKIQLLKDSGYNNVQTEALYSTIIASEKSHKVYEELKKLNGKNSIQSYMTFMLSDRESAKEDDGTLSGKSISGSKLHKVQNTLKGMGQLNTISKIYLEATQASIKKYAPRDYTVLKNYLNSASEAEQTIIMETIQGTTKMKNGKYEY